MNEGLLSPYILLFQATGCIGVLAVFLWILQRQSSRHTVALEIGGFFAIVVVLYTAFPLIMGYRRLVDNVVLYDSRFGDEQPTVEEIARIGWYHVLYLSTFCFAYLVARGRGREKKGMGVPPPAQLWPIMLTFLVITYAVYKTMGVFFNLQAGTYGESYIVLQSLPQVPRQIVGYVLGSQMSLQLFLLTYLFYDYKKNRPLIIGILAFAVGSAVFKLESRTDVAMLLMAYMILYDKCVQQIRPVAVGVLGSLFLVFLLMFGRIRNLDGGVNVSIREIMYSAFMSGDEFEAMFINAVDLHRKAAGFLVDPFHPSWYFSDIVNIVPQQFLWFDKFDHAYWYVTTYYRAFSDSGGGLAFGTICQGIVGFGGIEIGMRAAITGCLFGWIYKWYVARQRTFFSNACYIWLTLFSYQAFRNTSFALIYLSFQRVLLVAGVIVAVLYFIRGDLGERSARRRAIVHR